MNEYKSNAATLLSKLQEDEAKGLAIVEKQKKEREEGNNKAEGGVKGDEKKTKRTKRE